MRLGTLSPRGGKNETKEAMRSIGFVVKFMGKVLPFNFSGGLAESDDGVVFLDQM
jgi:hypothetical protein